MALARLYRHILDRQGNVQPFVSARVTLADTQVNAQLFADAAGLQPLTNPLSADDNGLLSCYAEEGLYDVYAIFSGSQRAVMLGLVVGDRLATSNAGSGTWNNQILPIEFDGQTQFSISQVALPASEIVDVDGHVLTRSVHYTLSGVSLTILPALGYSLSTSDLLSIRYQV